MQHQYYVHLLNFKSYLPVQAERQNRVLKWGEEDMNERFLTVEEIITKRRQEAMRKQGLQLVQILRVSQTSVFFCDVICAVFYLYVIYITFEFDTSAMI